MRLRTSCCFFLTALLAGLSILAGCSALPRNPVPLDLMKRAEVIGFPGVRAWAGKIDSGFQEDIITSIHQERPGDFPRNPDGSLDYSCLALSGGGDNGAFGAGFLCGWSKKGERPRFKLVTGISTGSLIAPFAFLGSEYDPLLKRVYTGISQKDIYKERGIVFALGNESFADSRPLSELINRNVDIQLLKAVANAHRNGRRLYVGTTNMDADRLAIWNMGAIAQSGHPEALDLFRKVFLASASVPAVLPPVFMEVEAEGERFDEMHVDGGTKTQVFFYGGVLDLENAAASVFGKKEVADHSSLYVIINGKLGPVPEQVTRSLKEITSRSLSTMIKAAALWDIYRAYTFAKRDGLGFRFVFIPDAFEFLSDERFDQGEMKRMFELGYQLGKSDDPWKKVPPGLGRHAPAFQ